MTTPVGIRLIKLPPFLLSNCGNNRVDKAHTSIYGCPICVRLHAACKRRTPALRSQIFAPSLHHPCNRQHGVPVKWVKRGTRYGRGPVAQASRSGSLRSRTATSAGHGKQSEGTHDDCCASPRQSLIVRPPIRCGSDRWSRTLVCRTYGTRN